MDVDFTRKNGGLRQVRHGDATSKNQCPKDMDNWGVGQQEGGFYQRNGDAAEKTYGLYMTLL